MRNVQHEGVGNLSQGLSRKADDLKNIIEVKITYALQACLHYFLVAVGAFGNSVNILVVKYFFLAVWNILAVFYYGKGNVGLESHELSVCIVKCNYPVADKEILVADIEVVFLKLAHLERGISVAAIKRSEIENRLFLVFQKFFINHFFRPLAVFQLSSYSRRCRIPYSGLCGLLSLC